MSILISIRSAVGLMEDCTDFDRQLISDINTVFLSTRQLGLGPANGKHVSSDLDTWESIFGDLNERDLEGVKTYVELRVRLLFDPPTSQALLTAMIQQADRLEWQLNAQVETPVIDKEE